MLSAVGGMGQFQDGADNTHQAQGRGEETASRLTSDRGARVRSAVSQHSSARVQVKPLVTRLSPRSGCVPRLTEPLRA